VRFLEESGMESSEYAIETPYGVLEGVAAVEKGEDGFERVWLERENTLKTTLGPLVPKFGERDGRPSLVLRNGVLLEAELERPLEVPTPAGLYRGDWVAFYPNGALESVGCRRHETPVLTFDLGYEPFAVAVAKLSFYRGGALREILFAEGAQAEVRPEPYWKIKTRFGLTVHETGQIHSLEPAYPVKAITPCGTYDAYDPNAKQSAGGPWSLRFDTQARITAVTTAGDRVYVRPISGVHYAAYAPDLSGERPVPLRLEFDYETEKALIVQPDGQEALYAFEDEFIIYPNAKLGCEASECEACGLCD